MADLPMYQQTEEYRPGTGPDLTSGYAAAEQLSGSIEKQAFGIAQQSADQAAAQQGAADAIQQGKDFKDSVSLTEAGRAYNKSGNPIAEHLAATQLATQFQGYYQQQITNGITPNSQATLVSQMAAATQKVAENSDPGVRSAIRLQASNYAAAYSSKLSNKMLAIKQAQGQIFQQNQVQENSSAVTSFASDAGYSYFDASTPAGKAAQAAATTGKGILLTQLNNGTLKPDQYDKQAEQIDKTGQIAAVIGQANKLTTSYRWAVDNHLSPQNLAQVFEQLQKFPSSILGNTHLTALNAQERETLSKRVQSIIKANNTSIVGNSKVQDANLKTVYFNSLNVPPNEETENLKNTVAITQSQKNREYYNEVVKPTIEINEGTQAFVNNLKEGTVQAAKTAISDPNRDYFPNSTASNDIKAAGNANVRKMAAKWINGMYNNTMEYIQSSTPYQTELHAAMNNLGTSDERNMLEGVKNGSIDLFNTILPNHVREQSINVTNAAIQQAETQGVPPNVNHFAWSNSQATQEGAKLESADQDTKLAMLNNLQANTGKNYPLYVSSLVKAGVPHGEFLAPILNQLGASGDKISFLLGAESQTSSKLWAGKDAKSVNTIYDTIGLKPADVQKAIMKDSVVGPELNKFYASLPAGSPVRQMTQQAMNTYVAGRIAENPSATASTIYDDAYKFIVGTQYQEVKSGYRIPTKLAVVKGNETQMTTLDGDTVHKWMDSMASHVMELGDVSAYNKATMKKFPGQNAKVVNMGHRDTLLGGATWKTSANDQYMYMVDSRGQAITNKKTGLIYGFNFSDTLPGSTKVLPTPRYGERFGPTTGELW